MHSTPTAAWKKDPKAQCSQPSQPARSSIITTRRLQQKHQSRHIDLQLSTTASYIPILIYKTRYCDNGRPQQWHTAQKAGTNAICPAGRMGEGVDAAVQTNALDQAHESITQQSRIYSPLVIETNT